LIVTGEINEVRAARWADSTFTWGLVPTMGYLHEGHLALVRRARAENDRVAVTIYVNPAQFAPTEDLSTYPRNLERDLDLLRPLGVDFVFTPTDAIMYPAGYQTYINVEQISRMLEGSSRPIHFRGVATVVAKLFNILQPTHAYFGQKDAQQTVVIRRMAADLNFNLEVVICPTVREADGLAMSSRNVYLTPEQRAAAPALYRALSAARDAYLSGERSGDRLRDILRSTVAAEQLARIDYVSAADPQTLVEVDKSAGDAILFSLAVFFGKTRLIDNIPANI
jgi:pantoate--beta-alanine ligase